MRIIKTSNRDSRAVLNEIINRGSRDNIEIEKR